MPEDTTEHVVPSQQLAHVLLRRDSLALVFLRAATVTILLALAAVIHPVPAQAWGCKGHQVVALLAESISTPARSRL